ncbi:ABC transporter ATP-binding protein [Allohahella sp. A8]|uniref:ABC transporter ATP-binding protein n=1 Tax=Allohahella sp. A8 TaxID=3141461 RepID=UPI003A7F87E4
MCSDTVINVDNVAKFYHIYEKPADRLKQFVLPRLRRHMQMKARVYYSEFEALKGVSFKVRRGETVGIVGHNGSGKSTLLQLICGTLNPSEGTVETTGRIAALLELGSGFNPEFTGRENVYLNGAVLGLTVQEIDEKYSEIEKFADIGNFIDQPVKTYSSGMVVRLAFSVAINLEPKILIVDEALAVGDERFQRKCFAKIEDIKRSGATILFVSHSASAVIELCDRAILLDHGRLLAEGAPKMIVGYYQKLMYSPVDQRQAIIQSFTEETKALATSGIEESSSSEEAFAESFDENLHSDSAVRYGEAKIDIADIRILNGRGDRVNTLLGGEIYTFNYTVRFREQASHVRFGIMIKTITGIEVGGSSSSSEGRKSGAQADCSGCYSVSFEWNCSLNPGFYFFNVGVRGLNSDGEDSFLARIVDAMPFKVAGSEDRLSTGVVNFSLKPFFTKSN